IAPHPAWADDPNAVVATVGDHKISEKDLDAKVRGILEKEVDQVMADKTSDKTFDLRRRTLESMTNDYLVEQAAQRDKLSVDDYLKQECAGEDFARAQARRPQQQRRSGARPQECARHDRRVHRLSVSVLQKNGRDSEAVADEIWRQDSHRTHGLPAAIPFTRA